MDLGKLTDEQKDAAMDEAYKNLCGHIEKFRKFDDFYRYFLSVVKVDDPWSLNKWLLRVLFVELTMTNTRRASLEKSDFEKLCDAVDEQKSEELKFWLTENLKKAMEAKK